MADLTRVLEDLAGPPVGIDPEHVRRRVERRRRQRQSRRAAVLGAVAVLVLVVAATIGLGAAHEASLDVGGPGPGVIDDVTGSTRTAPPTEVAAPDQDPSPDRVLVAVDALHDQPLTSGTIDLWLWQPAVESIVIDPADPPPGTAAQWRRLYTHVPVESVERTGTQTIGGHEVSRSTVRLVVPPTAAQWITSAQTAPTGHPAATIAVSPSSGPVVVCTPGSPCPGEPTFVPS